MLRLCDLSAVFSATIVKNLKTRQKRNETIKINNSKKNARTLSHITTTVNDRGIVLFFAFLRIFVKCAFCRDLHFKPMTEDLNHQNKPNRIQY